jgi:PucR C-terminal helix-turn-helix domain
MVGARAAIVDVRPDPGGPLRFPGDKRGVRGHFQCHPLRYHLAMRAQSGDQAADQQLTELGAALHKRIDALAAGMAGRITAEVSFYRDHPAVVPPAELHDSGGSASQAAARLFCHPNTVRHRLRRISAATGRSLSAPRDVAELCLAPDAARQHPG